MIHQKKIITAAVAAWTLSLSPAFAQHHHEVVTTTTVTPVVNNEAAIRELLNKRIDASLRPGNLDIRPDDPSDRITDIIGERIQGRLNDEEQTPHAGMSASKEYKGYKGKEPVQPECTWFCNPSVFGEYQFISSDDERTLGSDSNTHSFELGGDFRTIGDLLVGTVYSFSDLDGHSNFLHSTTSIDSHYVSLYVARSFWRFLNVGISTGYGHSDIESSVHGPRGKATASQVETWNYSPFIGLSHRFGALSTSLTTTFLQTNSWNDSPNRATDDETGKVMVKLNIGYAVTEKLNVSASARYTWVVEHEASEKGFEEDYQWATFGTKITYHVTEPFEVYAGYEADVWNQSYENHTVKGGVSYAF